MARNFGILIAAIAFLLSLTPQRPAMCAPSSNPDTKATVKSAWLTTLAKAESDSKALSSSDAAIQSQAATDLLAFVKANPGGAAANSKKWLPNMLTSKHYTEVIQATDVLLVSVAVDNPASIESLMPYRIEAFKGLNQPSDALVAAKQYYNVCAIKSSAAAITAVAQCLKLAHPDDATIDDRFRTEQQTRGGNEAPAADGQPLILDAVKVESKPYDDAMLKHLAEKYADLISRGNLSLLADKPADARDFFERAYAIAPDSAKATTAAEGIARAIRAKTRSVGAANAWILSLQTKPLPDPQPPAAPRQPKGPALPPDTP